MHLLLAGIEATPLAYTENAAATVITNLITVTDVDDTNIESAVISISGNYQNGQDILSFTNANGITGTWNAVSGILNLTGSSTLANYQLALRSIRYFNNSENPSTLSRIITFTVNDGNLSSIAVTPADNNNCCQRRSGCRIGHFLRDHDPGKHSDRQLYL